MKQKTLLTVAVGVFVLAGSSVYAGVHAGDLCKEKKEKAAGKKAFDLLKAFGKNTKKSNGAKLAQDVSKAESKFTKGFSKADALGGDACPFVGDASDVELSVDGWVSEVIDLISVGPPVSTTTSTTATTATSTMPTSTTSTTVPGVCGDSDVNQPSEECDGTDDIDCPGMCQVDCTCPPILFFDDFNRPNADDLNNGWEAQPGTPPDLWTLANNEALMSFEGIGNFINVARLRPLAETAGVVDVSATVDFITTNPANFPEIWLRYQDVATDDGYIFYTSDNGEGLGTGVVRVRGTAFVWNEFATWIPTANTTYRMSATVVNGAGNDVGCTLQIIDLDADAIEVFNKTWIDDGTLGLGCSAATPCSIRRSGRTGLSGNADPSTGCIACTIRYDNFKVFDLDPIP